MDTPFEIFRYIMAPGFSLGRYFNAYAVILMLTGTLFSLLKCSGGFLEAHSMKELIEIVSNLLIEAIQLGSFVVLEFGVSAVGSE